jgi:hypothetical protein
MKKNDKKHQSFKVRLPGFIVENDIGLGDIIKRTTSAIGIKPCGGCKQRAEILNSYLTVTSKSK